ncbi:hypothetical protein HY636_03370 [Candidatus Woesearchaeota archaeon]|nr:hypothetical protein [Candidatus Woesearchaeota archaeon]
MAIAQHTQPQTLVPPKIALQTSGLTQVHIKGPGDDDLGEGLDDGLDDLIRRHTAQRPEDKKAIEVIGERKFGELWVKYERALNIVDTLKVDLIEEYLGKIITDVLTPQDIEEFLKLTAAYENSQYYQKCTTKIVNKLIENSHTAGHSEFVLDTRNLLKPLDNLCTRLRASGDKPINIIINGTVGKDFGFSAGYSVSFTTNGDVGSCGYNSTCSNFTIKGNVDYISNPGNYSSFNIDGNLRAYSLGVSNNSSLTITGEIEELEVSVYSKNCTFKTPNPKTLDVFLRRIPLFEGHKIYFINEEGNEKQVGMFERFVKRVGYKLKK